MFHRIQTSQFTLYEKTKMRLLLFARAASEQQKLNSKKHSSPIVPQTTATSIAHKTTWGAARFFGSYQDERYVLLSVSRGKNIKFQGRIIKNLSLSWMPGMLEMSWMPGMSEMSWMPGMSRNTGLLSDDFTQVPRVGAGRILPGPAAKMFSLITYK
jgi:hypothetical protein